MTSTPSQNEGLHPAPADAKTRTPEERPASAKNHAGETSDSGLRLLADILRHKRKKRRWSAGHLARLAGVPGQAVIKLERYQVNSVGLEDLIAIATTLKSKLSVTIGPAKPKLPRTNQAILRAFDQLMKTPGCRPFFRKQSDKEYAGVLWDIVGDAKRNWLFVVATNRKQKLRFAKVTDNPGGWSIAGQHFGIDAETDAIARELSEQLLKERRTELTT
jgi:transcriptional regulator with XRE-family HTH domain